MNFSHACDFIFELYIFRVEKKKLMDDDHEVELGTM